MIKDILLITIFPGGMALAAASDLFTMTLPNRLVIFLVAGFFIVAPVAGLGWSDIGVHAALAAAALILAFFMFSFGWIGGGDAKLLAASCLWLGPGHILTYALYTALIGGALTLVFVLWRMAPLPSTLGSQGWIARLHSPKEGVPFGIALGTAGLFVYPGTSFVAALGG